MKRFAVLALIFCLVLTACGGGAYTCTDPLGCVVVGAGKPITIAAALTLSGSNSPYGTDALRGIEIAISDHGDLLGRSIELIREDELCSEAGGEAAATALAAKPEVVGVIGPTCSGAAVSAAKILTEAGMVLISPSSTAASLTSATEHQEGFLRTIYNDKSQAHLVAEFAFQVLGVRTMATIHDGTPYSMELQEEACLTFEQLGGQCLAQAQIKPGQDVTVPLEKIAALKPEVLYFPVYTADGVQITKNLATMGLINVALIGSDGLLSSDFISQAKSGAQGMYISGPSTLKVDPSFYDKYQARYGEKPIAVYAAQAYDAAMILFSAIDKVAVRKGSTLYIPRQALRDALYHTSNFPGLSGTLTCSPLGDCAAPNIVIYQLHGNDFKPIYP
jgi:branched-chain amino acid transport system substrate-binding protein